MSAGVGWEGKHQQQNKCDVVRKLWSTRVSPQTRRHDS